MGKDRDDYLDGRPGDLTFEETLHGRFQRLLALAKSAGFDPLDEFHQMDMVSMTVLIAERLGTKPDYIPEDALLLEVPLEVILTAGISGERQGWCGTPALEEQAIDDCASNPDSESSSE